MTTDARNSVYLWVGGLTVSGLFWAGLHFDVLNGIPDTWLWPLLGVTIAINLTMSAWGFWKLRVSGIANPDHR